MESVRIMAFGYDKKEAGTIQNQLEQLIGTRVTVISAVGREHDTIESILSENDPGEFKDESPKVLMFLGFSDSSINTVLQEFSNFKGVHRPIFCGLTEDNIKWPVEQLLSHLEEEQRYWSKQKKEIN